MTCPLLYRFRVIDRLPEPPTQATARGTLVHAALERLFDLPAADRTPAAARALLTQEWDRLAAEEPDLAALFDNEAERSGWLASATAIVDAYFTLEDPRRLEPAEREAYVETTLESGLRLRGYIDRLDVAPSGDIRIVDYKTGRAPREAYEASALFQMKFYALVIWRLRGQVPRLLQLMYLAEGEVLRYSPDESDLLATERKVAALWKAIERARDAGDWRPRPSRLCDWCNHKALCPEFGGTPPPLPAGAQRRWPSPCTRRPSPSRRSLRRRPRDLTNIRLGQDGDQQGERGQDHRGDRRPGPPGRDGVLWVLGPARCGRAPGPHGCPAGRRWPWRLGARRGTSPPRAAGTSPRSPARAPARRTRCCTARGAADRIVGAGQAGRPGGPALGPGGEVERPA